MQFRRAKLTSAMAACSTKQWRLVCLLHPALLEAGRQLQERAWPCPTHLLAALLATTQGTAISACHDILVAALQQP